jgi:hypothetical protein
MSMQEQDKGYVLLKQSTGGQSAYVGQNGIK